MTAGFRRSFRRSALVFAIAVAAACRPAPSAARTIVEAGFATVWKYSDGGTDPGPGWKDPGFDDSIWKAGRAPLGYGESRLGTRVRFGPDEARKPITTWFRREFDAPELDPGGHLAILVCVDDGAVLYLNGREIGRVNLPGGPVDARTPALRALSDDEEGFYARLRVPAGLVQPGRPNLLAVEIHQASPASSDLFFDLAIKAVPPGSPAPEVPAPAREVVDAFNVSHFVGPGVAIPDGYLDGGRRMTIDAGGHATSGREILRVDRARDVELAGDLAFARSPALRALPIPERIRRIADRIDAETTPPGGIAWVDRTTERLEAEFRDRPVLIGDWVDQAQAGVCRHRALLFKILADEAGLDAALVRGNYAQGGRLPGFPHAWNEVMLDGGRRVLVDVMHEGGEPRFREVTAPDVVLRYRRVDDSPWYEARPARSIDAP